MEDLVADAVSGPEAERAEELLEFVGMAEFAHQPAWQLSFGQQKLVELAQVLMLEPRLVLLDEPAGGVNPGLIERIAELIRALNRNGLTFLIVEHNMPVVLELCDPILVMARGRVIAEGDPSGSRATPPCSMRTSARVGQDGGAGGRLMAPILELREVDAGYAGAQVLRGVDLQVERGRITCVIGPNGAGKSTLLRRSAASSVRCAARSSWTARRSTACPAPRSSHTAWLRCRSSAPCSRASPFARTS